VAVFDAPTLLFSVTVTVVIDVFVPFTVNGCV
jgi:hypothetical protein